jgi:hypothetical protein
MAFAPDRPASDSSSREPNLQTVLERFSTNPGGKPAIGAQDASPLAHANAWRRIARELPDYLEISDGFADVAFERRRVQVRAGLSGGPLPIVGAVGLVDTGRHDLRLFEGLKEGFASVGDR